MKHSTLVWLSIVILSLVSPVRAEPPQLSNACEKILVFWQGFTAKILNNDAYALQKRQELTARLGRAQGFIARKKIEPQTLRLEKRFSEGGDTQGHQTQLILGYWGERRVMIKIFWQDSERLDDEIGGLVIQDFLAEMEIAPKVYGIILDDEKIKQLKAVRDLPFMVDRHVRSGMYMAVVMEYISKSFNIPNGKFMPSWYTALDKRELNEQLSRLESVLWRLGIRRQSDGEFLVTQSQRVYALDFSSDAFNPDQDQHDPVLLTHARVE